MIRKIVFDEKVTQEIAARIAKAGEAAQLVFIPKSDDGKSIKFYVGVRTATTGRNDIDDCDDPPMNDSWVCPPAPPQFCS